MDAKAGFSGVTVRWMGCLKDCQMSWNISRLWSLHEWTFHSYEQCFL